MEVLSAEQVEDTRLMRVDDNRVRKLVDSHETLRAQVAALEAERGQIQEAAYRLTERVRNCLPSLGMGRVPSRDMLLKVEQYVGELEDALQGEKP